MLSSAVLIPSPDRSPTPPSALAPPLSGTKRSSSALASPPANTTIDSDPNKRRRSSNLPASKEERARGQRLLGGLLSTLAKSNKDATTSRRSAPSQRLQSGHGVRSPITPGRVLSKEELEAVRVRRENEYEVLVEVSWKRRVEGMRSEAGFLRTVAEPRLFYLPWETTQEEEEILEVQKENVEKMIEAEERLHERRVTKQRGERAEIMLSAAKVDQQISEDATRASAGVDGADNLGDGTETTFSETMRQEAQARRANESTAEGAVSLVANDESKVDTPTTNVEQTERTEPEVDPAEVPVTAPEDVVLADSAPENVKEEQPEADEVMEETGEDSVIY